MKKIITLLSIVLLVACGSKDGEKKRDAADLKAESNGRINHVIVVVEPYDWKGKLEESFVELISDPIPGLPQLEYQLNVSTIPHSAFTKMFKNNRNVLKLDIGQQENFRIYTDKYARPQTIVEVAAPDKKALVALIQKRGAEIVEAFKEGDIKSTQKEHASNRYTKKIDALNKLGVSMTIPNKYRMVMDTLGSFLWMRSHIAGGVAVGDQTNELLVYQAPLFDESKPIVNQIIKNRDSIGKMFIRGNDVDKMYMITEAARTPVVKEVRIHGKKAYETRGTWEVFGAYNAGPFLNYSIVDEKNNRVIVVEGFNYAPSVNKRDFVFELEAILKTTQLK
ncbi:DUF4837 family protein [Ochrovirga pacifica]|uniref:DUF4837 family protein n=1 Tax=Ochrovirga pacifica TaxID=1042376 RepID=UPI00025591E8|nr:DUF4837 family protein [Ochrovirga pacifica]